MATPMNTRISLGSVARTQDRRALFALWVISLILQLGGLDHPRSVVFDEVHVGEFANHYCCDHTQFFDVHRPHGELVIAAVAQAAGYRGDLRFDHIGQPYDVASVVPLRMAPAIAGALLSLIVFSRLRSLGASLAGAGTAPGACSGGGLLGLALDTKLIGLAIVPVIGADLLVRLLPASRRDAGVRVALAFAWIVCGAVLVQLAGWALHFALLTRPDPAEFWPRPGFGLLADIVSTTWEMFIVQRDHDGQHAYGSRWWSWPLMLGPVYCWAGDPGTDIWFVGNVLVWWGVAAGLAALVFGVIAVSLFIDANGWTRTGGLRQQRPACCAALLAGGT